MAALQVKPTRMELSNLKKRLKVAVRGHKLMKDKRDEMVRRFIVYVKRNKALREQVEAKLAAAMQGFVLARASMSAEAVEEALCYPARPAEITVSSQHVLSVVVPKLELSNVGKVELPQEYAPYVEKFCGYMSCKTVFVCILTYGDQMVFGFVSAFLRHSLERNFFRRLTELGIHVEIGSNDYDREEN